MSVIILSCRLFKIWSFSASHGQLTLRSNPDESLGLFTRVEIYAGNVAYMSLRPTYEGVEVRRADEGMENELKYRYGLPDTGKGDLFLFNSVDFVVSGEPVVREKECDFDDPSLFSFDIGENV